MISSNSDVKSRLVSFAQSSIVEFLAADAMLTSVNRIGFLHSL